MDRDRHDGELRRPQHHHRLRRLARRSSRELARDIRCGRDRRSPSGRARSWRSDWSRRRRRGRRARRRPRAGSRRCAAGALRCVGLPGLGGDRQRRESTTGSARSKRARRPHRRRHRPSGTSRPSVRGALRDEIRIGDQIEWRRVEFVPRRARPRARCRGRCRPARRGSAQAAARASSSLLLVFDHRAARAVPADSCFDSCFEPLLRTSSRGLGACSGVSAGGLASWRRRANISMPCWVTSGGVSLPTCDLVENFAQRRREIGGVAHDRRAHGDVAQCARERGRPSSQPWKRPRSASASRCGAAMIAAGDAARHDERIGRSVYSIADRSSSFFALDSSAMRCPSRRPAGSTETCRGPSAASHVGPDAGLQRVGD